MVSDGPNVEISADPSIIIRLEHRLSAIFKSSVASSPGHIQSSMSITENPFLSMMLTYTLVYSEIFTQSHRKSRQIVAERINISSFFVSAPMILIYYCY